MKPLKNHALEGYEIDKTRINAGDPLRFTDPKTKGGDAFNIRLNSKANPDKIGRKPAAQASSLFSL